MGAAILGELLNDLSERNGEPSPPRAPAGDEGADAGGEAADGVVTKAPDQGPRSDPNLHWFD